MLVYTRHSLHTATYAPMFTPSEILSSEHPRALKFGLGVGSGYRITITFFGDLSSNGSLVITGFVPVFG